MNNEETIRSLRDALRRAEEERDVYRRAAQQLMSEKYPPPGEEELRKDIEEIQRTGVPFSQIVDEITARFGKAS